MKFSDFMMAIHRCDVVLPTHMTPYNFEEAKEEFLTNPSLEVPKFEYKHYTFFDALDKLDHIERKLNSNEASAIRPAQRQIITEYLTATRACLNDLMMMQCYRNPQSTALTYDKMQSEIVRYNAFLNDIPQTEVYQALLEGEGIEEAVFVPKPETVQKFRKLLEEKWAKSFTRIDTSKEEYTPQEVCDLVNTVIQEDFGFETPFYAAVNSGRTLMNVNQSTRVLEIPAKRVNGKFTPKNIRETVLGHETFGHLYRAAFMQTKHPEIGIPLPGYLTFEEGVTKCIEQALGSGYELVGAESYVACGAAYCDQLTFREAFNRCCSYLRTRKCVSELSKQQYNTVFSRITRAFRGTGYIPWTGTTVYFNGPIKVWPFIEKHIDNPDYLWKMLFESGKTDPTSESHQELLALYDE